MFPFICSPETRFLSYTIWPCGIKYLDSSGGQPMSIPGSWGYVSPVLHQQARQTCRSLVNGVVFLPFPTDHSWYNGMMIICCMAVTYVLLCGCTPSRRFEVGHTTGDMKEVIRHMAGDRIDFHDLD